MIMSMSQGKTASRLVNGKDEEKPALSSMMNGVGNQTNSNEETVEGGPVSEKKGMTSATNTAADGTRKPTLINPNFGGHTLVKASGSFPGLGSTLGAYFCMGRLGKGTFCSIHKCINLHHFHRLGIDSQQIKHSRRLAAAKVEIGEFRNSGVLGGEATMLQFLDSALPENTVPVYMGHYRGDADVSAIVMEYLPGQDMHIIRDWATKTVTRRISVQDAVYLTATMMLPLLQRMHQVGIVHRDVKPSNCVKRGLKDFLMVDFGLSKSVVVPKDSTLSDPDHPWKGTDWIRSPSHSGEGYYRKERASAEFRGTSMYASVRVHQLKDYCPRDDMWSLLYVFCDLVSGGLPWMSHAANRDREACRKLKERIHGEQEGRPDETERLLLGHEYHVALFKKFKGGVDPPEGVNEDDGTLPEPLPMSKDPRKVELMRKAFKHLGELSFWDIPDYDLIKNCIEGFLDDNVDPSIAPIDWQKLEDSMAEKRYKSKPLLGKELPTWNFVDDEDPVDSDMFTEAEISVNGEMPEVKPTGHAADLARLPLELQFRIAQMEYNTLHHDSISPHLALKDWMKVALPILHGDWDSNKFERGGHRSNGDGYRREFYLKIIGMCMKFASKFNNFTQLDCTHHRDDENGLAKKRRKIISTITEPNAGSLGSDLIAISQVSFGLRAAKKAEEKLSRAPPPRLMFGSSR
jgi:serine/threonine protein kinase